MQSTQAQPLPAQTFEDQWEKPVALDESVNWLIVSLSMDAGDMVKQSLDTLELRDLDAYQAVYLADISGMPSLISKLFAIPKMRDYSFRMALAKDEEALEALNLPVTDTEAVNIFRLQALDIVEQAAITDQEALTNFIRDRLQSASDQAPEAAQ
ncbi:MAG TPA: hypothetical protein DD979_04970 [Gammaproteobacteria bacterium]|nr:hypothetical protein [Gammaproteobacteria bacterium]